MSTAHKNYFDFERLDVYTLSVDVNRAISTLDWPAGRSHMKDQAIRAADSMALNIAEGAERRRGSKAAKSHRAAFGFSIAKGLGGRGVRGPLRPSQALSGPASAFAGTLGPAALRCSNILDLDPGSRGKLQRIGSMLARLSR